METKVSTSIQLILVFIVGFIISRWAELYKHKILDVMHFVLVSIIAVYLIFCEFASYLPSDLTKNWVSISVFVGIAAIDAAVIFKSIDLNRKS